MPAGKTSTAISNCSWIPGVDIICIKKHAEPLLHRLPAVGAAGTETAGGRRGVLPSHHGEEECRPHREVGPSHQPVQRRAPEPPCLHGGHSQAGQRGCDYAIDAIQTAIHEQRAISFQYFEYTPKKEKVLKHKRGVPLWLQPLRPHLEPGFLLRRGLVGKAQETGPVPCGPHDSHSGVGRPLHSRPVLRSGIHLSPGGLWHVP